MKRENVVWGSAIGAVLIGLVMDFSRFKIAGLSLICVGMTIMVAATVVNYYQVRQARQQARIESETAVATFLEQCAQIRADLKHLNPAWVPDTQLELPFDQAGPNSAH